MNMFKLFNTMTEKERLQYELDEAQARYEIWERRTKDAYSQFTNSEAHARAAYREVKQLRQKLGGV